MNPPMRMLILLAVFGTAGSLLLAAESPSTSAPKPAATANKAESGTQSGTQSATQSTTPSTAKTDTKEATKDKEASKDGDKKSGSGSDKPSIAEQAEAALKAAYEADPGSTSKAPPQGDEAKDDTQTPPTGSVAKGPSPQRFVPTEQVRADFDVSFPIDI